MRTIDPSEIPKDVIAAAATISAFFKNRGILAWQLGEIRSRTAGADAPLLNAADRVLFAWDTSVLRRSHDGMMCERMEALRAVVEASK